MRYLFAKKKLSMLILFIFVVSAFLLSNIIISRAQMADPVCGNGIIEPGEECDDGNNINRDGCNYECLIEDSDFNIDFIGILVRADSYIPPTTIQVKTNVGMLRTINVTPDTIIESGTDGFVGLNIGDQIYISGIENDDGTIDAVYIKNLSYNNEPSNQPPVASFTFAHIADVHIGSNMLLDWYEGWSYPRFTDALYEIEKEKFNPRPDFILIGGDNVEYAGSEDGIRWLEDFKSITDNFTERTGIKFYIVPGNHDRYERAAGKPSGDFLSGGNDWLENYFKVMGKQKDVNLLFPFLADFSSGLLRGYNRYNYYFNYKGIQFIGLDSGEDTGKWDTEPESTGLSDNVMSSLDLLAQDDPNLPRVIFMHHPVYSGKISLEKDNGTGERVPNGSITGHWRDFINYCEKANVQIVLSGHDHKAQIFNATGDEANGNDISKPLFIQTQSATKKDGHGYRIIDVKNEVAIPRVSNETMFYSKIIADLDQNEDIRLVKFKAYENPANLDSYFQNKDYNFSIPYFMANSSDRVIVYDYTNNFSKFSMSNLFPDNDKYDLFVSKNEEDFTKFALDSFRNNGIIGFKVKNSEYCKNPLSGEKCDGGFLAVFNSVSWATGKRIDLLKFKDMNIKGETEDNVFITWSSIPRWPLPPLVNGVLPGIDLRVNGNSETIFETFKKEIIVDLHSPGELQVVDPAGRVSGLVNGKIKEEIPYSFYDEINEAVVLFVTEDVSDNLYAYKVVGSDNATYGLSITKKEVYEGIENVISFNASSIPTSANIVHQYSIDWEALSQGEKGVTLQIDADGDGIFEQTIKADATLQPPTADINGLYEGNEGFSITFDASSSSDPDGEIILYEWDFDGDGIYDASSTSPTIEYTWGDNYQREIILRVTDDEGLTDIATTSVIVNNVAPIVSNLSVEGPVHPNQEIWAGDTLNFSGDFTDAGWLDTHTAEWDFGNGTTAIGAIAQENNPPVAIGQVARNYVFYNAGIYAITLTVIDDDGGVSADTLQVVVKPIPAAIDCNPDTLNLKSGGKWITCYIELPAGYDVWQIDGSTIILNEVISAYLGKEGWAKPESNESNITDHDEDGILERMVKFDREAVQDILNPGEAVVLIITGKVFYNQGLADFEGQDTIRVIDNEHRLVN